MLRQRGAEYVDADRIVHDLLGPGGAAVEPVLHRFGTHLRDPSGGVDRKRLGNIVFHDAFALRDLEAMLHPSVRTEIRRRAAGTPAHVLVVDAIKLIEGGLFRDCDVVWVVTCPPELQLERLTQQRGLSRAEAEARIAAQPDQASRLPLARVVLDNGSDLVSLERQVQLAWGTLPVSRS